MTRRAFLAVAFVLSLLAQFHIHRSGISIAVSPFFDDQAVIPSLSVTAREWEYRTNHQPAATNTDPTTERGMDAGDSVSNLLEGLPDWVRTYIDWHQLQRQKFPGTKLFTDPAAPPVLLRTCYRICGGLHDRLGKLPWDLYLANQTGRVLLMNWCHPAPLEEFLLPNLLDWTLPRDLNAASVDDGVPAAMRLFHNETTCLWTEKMIPTLFDEASHEHRPRPEFWSHYLDEGIRQDNVARGDQKRLQEKKVVRHRILGGELEFQKRLEMAGETTDLIDWTPSFGKIFGVFFQPSFGVQRELDKVYRDLRLIPGQYSAVHCRVRHPNGIKKFSKGKTPVPGGPDRVGLLWEGEGREFAIETAVHALQCGQTLLHQGANEMEPIYFYSDSEDLVRYVTIELHDPMFEKNYSSILDSNKIHATARKVVQRSRIVGRHDGTANLHIDRQGGAKPTAYYGSFVDLMVAAQSRCVTYGVGNYAMFASKISGSSCRLQHQEESWGVDENKKERTKLCSLPS
jgi:hypothetical protein